MSGGGVLRYLSNIHTHSNMSDGKNTLEEMVLAALDRGFVSLGFSDHGWAPYDSDCSMSIEGEKIYREECARLREKYAGRIDLAVGYEHCALAPDTDLSVYDYVIKSVHRVLKDGEYLGVDHSPEIFDGIVRDYYGGDPYGFVRDYFDLVCWSIQNIPGEILGHIDLITKFNQDDCRFSTSDPRFVGPALETLRLAVEKDMIVEINTGAMSRGYRKEPYPGPALLKALKDMNGRITISSDCHRAEWIDFAFDQAAEMAKAAGFKENYIWKNGGLCPQPIAAAQ